MAFTQPCFIRKNTPELRKKLDELGYEPCHQMTIHPDFHKNIAVCNFFGSRYYGVTDIDVSCTGDIADAIKNRGMIDCGTNEELFLALTALRDDSDYMQWFICDDNESMFKVDKPYMSMEEYVYNYMDGWDTTGARKATAKEIIKHFNKNK